jgi:hypothetical protein
MVYSLALADFDGDGTLDIVVGSDDGSVLTVDVLLNLGNGTFAPFVSYTADETKVIAGDLNGDGKPDLVVGLSVRLNNGNGTFAAAVPYATSGNVWSLADLDGDGKLDIVVLNPGTSMFGVLLGNGNGTFAAPVEYPTTTPATGEVLVEDLDGDGKPDVVVESGLPLVSVHRNNGNGTFAAAVTYSTGVTTIPHYIASGDINGDGKRDLVVSGFGGGSNIVNVLLNAGNATFPTHTPNPAGDRPGALAIADLDEDGKPDLVVGAGDSCGSCAAATVLLNNGNGVFFEQRTYGGMGGGQAELLAIGDLNGDGKPDLVLSDVKASGIASGVAVLLHVP